MGLCLFRAVCKVFQTLTPLAVVCPLIIPLRGRLPLAGVLIVDMLRNKLLVKRVNTKTRLIRNIYKAVLKQRVVDTESKPSFFISIAPPTVSISG